MRTAIAYDFPPLPLVDTNGGGVWLIGHAVVSNGVCVTPEGLTGLAAPPWASGSPRRQDLDAGALLSAICEPQRQVALSALTRLHHKFWRWTARGVSVGKVKVALARELAGFVWAMMTIPEIPEAAAAKSNHSNHLLESELR